MNSRNALQPINNAVEVEVIKYIPPKRHIASNLRGTSHRRELENIQHAAMMEKCKAVIAFSAAQHAAALSQIEAQAGLINPRAGARCGAIADMYTAAAMVLIEDGEKQ